MSKSDDLKRRATMVKETIGALKGKDKNKKINSIAKRLYLGPRTIRNDLKE
jgi:hypothetical protein